MPNADVKEVRNVAILSHGAAGKTSLADAILYAAGSVDLQGSVDAGSSVFMHEPEEISRKITITSSLVTQIGRAFASTLLILQAILIFLRKRGERSERSTELFSSFQPSPV